MTHLIAQTAASSSSAPAQTGMPGGGMSMLLFYGLIAIGFYFLFIAPQRKKQKAHERMLSSLQSGDEIITTGGIYGTITNVKDDRFVLRISDTTKIEVSKGFVQSVTKKSGVEEKKST